MIELSGDTWRSNREESGGDTPQKTRQNGAIAKWTSLYVAFPWWRRNVNKFVDKLLPKTMCFEVCSPRDHCQVSPHVKTPYKWQANELDKFLDSADTWLAATLSATYMVPCRTER